MPKVYKQDLAYVHDVGFGAFAERAAPGVLRVLQGRSGASAERRKSKGRTMAALSRVAATAECTSDLVVDLGCGSGLWARRLTDAGYRVLGIDISADMIAMARKRVPGGSFATGSFLDVDFPKCVAITALGEVFNYGFDKRNSRAALSKLFRRAFRALLPGGVLIFDVAGPGRARGWGRRFWKGADWACLTEFVHDERRQRLTRHITTFRRVGKHYRRAEETHLQQLYRASQLADDLRKLGFRVRIVRGYGDLRFPKAHAGLIARKTL